MPDTIATPTRELAYLGAAAGNNDAPANPARLEEQLYAKMAARISALEQSSGGGGVTNLYAHSTFPAAGTQNVPGASYDNPLPLFLAESGGSALTYTRLKTICTKGVVHIYASSYNGEKFIFTPVAINDDPSYNTFILYCMIKTQSGTDGKTYFGVYE